MSPWWFALLIAYLWGLFVFLVTTEGTLRHFYQDFSRESKVISILAIITAIVVYPIMLIYVKLTEDTEQSDD